MTYTAGQIATAKTVYTFWVSKGATDFQAAAWVGNVDGECSLEGWLIGDHGTAYGIDQDHMDRVNEILKGCGIDMRTATLEQQCEATYWEVTKGWYRSVWPGFKETTSLAAAVDYLVEYFEQSGDQPRDDARRLVLSQYWLTYAQKNWVAK